MFSSGPDLDQYCSVLSCNNHNELSVFLLAFCMTKGTCRMGGDMRLERARQDHAAMDGARQDHAAMDGGNDGSVRNLGNFGHNLIPKLNV